MCGFFASNDPIVTLDCGEKINNRLAFRGPDGNSGLQTFGQWKLYHSRLSIIAPDEKYDQPFVGPDGSITLFNGEFLNYKDIAKEFNLPDSQSDTEVLVSFLESGKFDANKIDGFFAFVHIDSSGNLNHCIRDKFGVKPLYYHKRREFISISSEPSLLSEIFDLNYKNESLEEYRAFRAPIFSGSYFVGVESIAPGSCLVNGQYFDPANFIEEKYLEKEEYEGRLELIIQQSIYSRLTSDAPVGILYSGGIDSNLISTFCPSNLVHLSGGFIGDYDLEFARSSNKRAELIEVTDHAFSDRLRKMIALRKEPLSVPNEVVLSLIAEKWKAMGGKVLLSGEAADEFFGGYDKIYSWANQTSHLDMERFLDMYCYREADQIAPRVKAELSELLKLQNDLSPVERVRHFFITVHLPILFRRLDFSLMYSGIEGREPLASFDMFKLAMQIDPRDLFGQELGKQPLRKIAAKYLGNEFAWRAKVGFPIDLGKIFRGKPAISKHENYTIWEKINLELLG